MNRHLYFKQQEENELYHHGIKGQKWGIRRFQNEDGSYTEEGRKRYGIGENGEMSKSGSIKYYKDYVDTLSKEYDAKKGVKPEDQTSDYLKKKAEFIRKQYEKDGRDFEADKKAYEEQKAKNAKVGRTVAISAAATLATTYIVVNAASALNTVKTGETLTDNTKKRDGPDPLGWNYGRGVPNVMRDDEDVIVEKGHEIRRMTNDKDERSKGKSEIFVSLDKDTHDRYKQLLPDRKNQKLYNYERKMEANKELKIAGGKTIINILQEAHPDMPRSEVEKLAWNVDYSFVLSDDDKQKRGIFNDVNLVKSKLKEQGYAGVQDYNDKGLWGKGQTILFDQTSNTSDDEKVKKIGYFDRLINGLTLKQCTFEDVFGADKVYDSEAERKRLEEEIKKRREKIDKEWDELLKR